MTDVQDCASMQLQQYKNSTMTMPRPTLTMSNGAPIWNKSASLTIGPAGPLLLQDIVHLDELAHFDRERIPERVVHAKGAGAHGYFEVTEDITRYTSCCVFNNVGKRTPVFVRFSFIGGEHGTADTNRDIRGFAIKFYTEEGNWDLVGNSSPLFFVRDPIHFASMVHSRMRNPVTGMHDASAFWDFCSIRQESAHVLMWIHSDRGIPDGYPHMDGFGAHTFKLVNADGEPVYCKFHFKTAQGNKWLSDERAQQLRALDPDYATRDLYNAIANGNYPVWTMYIQVMSMEQANTFEFNPFDLTKIWPHNEFPMIPVGRLVLDRNPENYFAEVEQAAFSPGRIIPGIEFSPDKVLASRVFSYPDTQFHRLGPNFMQLPINCPYRTQAANYQIDGMHCTQSRNGIPNYYPNSHNGPEVLDEQHTREHVWSAVGQVFRHEFDPDDIWTQPRVFWEKVLDEPARQRLVNNIVSTLVDASSTIQERVINMFGKVHPRFGIMLQEAMNPHMAKMEEEEKPKQEKMTTMAGQTVRGMLEESMKKLGLEP